MHYCLEIIMPPTDDPLEAVRGIMAPFDEGAADRGEKDEDGDPVSDRHAFWDWYVIGGRWAGQKFLAQFDPEKIDEFYDWLREEQVTVSGVVFGKREIEPADQIPKIDAKWNEMFPETNGGPCPLFQHSANPYGKGMDSAMPGDICPLKDMPERLRVSYVIVAAPGWNSDSQTHDGPPKAEFMVSREVWNGVNWLKTNWDGSVKSALEMHTDACNHYKEEYKERRLPKDNWLTVTVDFHT